MTAAQEGRIGLPDPVMAAVRAGLNVVPASSTKTPRVEWRKWQDRAQTPEEVATLGHGSLWAVVVGERAGTVVLDFDSDVGLATMEALGLEPHVRTATGAHVYVTRPPWPVRSSAKAFPDRFPGLDVKGDKSLAFFAGRSKKGKYEPVAGLWPPQPIELPPDLVAELFPQPQPEAERAPESTWTGAGHGTARAVRYLVKIADDVRHAPPGTSNAELNKAAYSVGGLVAAGQLDEAFAYESLMAAALARSAGDPESVIPAAMASGAELPWTFEPDDDDDDDDPEWTLAVSTATRTLGNSAAAVRPLTDLGNAQRMVDRHGADVRWVADVGTWFVWRAGRWVRDTGSTWVRHLAQVTAQGIHEEAAREGVDRDQQKLVSQWALTSQGAFKLRAMEEQARYRPEVQAERADFDQHPRLVNFRNGTLDLDTGDFRAHRREDLLTKMLPSDYDPDASCQLWLNVLERALPDPEMRAYLQRALGTGLIGQVPDRSFFLLYGRPGTGKSIVVETVASVLGEYALKAKPEALLQGRGSGGPTPELAELEGRRFVYVSETEQHARMAVARMKDMTGSGRINGRRNREDGGEFPLLATLLMDTNHPPAMGGDHGAWDRVHLLTFSDPVPESGRRDRHDLLAALAADAPGILNWLVDGARQYLAGGLRPPAAAVEQRDRLREEEDHVGQFVSERCDIGPAHRAEPARVFDDYSDWCRTNGVDGYQNQNAFWRDAAVRDFAAVKSNGRRFRQGLRLREGIYQAAA